MEDRRAALDELFVATYGQLRRLAARVRAGDPQQTLNSTALINEAYLKLSASLPLAPESELHFKRIAARAMRQILVEAARRRATVKRGSGSVLLPLDEERCPDPPPDAFLVALNGLLDDLQRRHPRAAQVVEFRFFGGYSLPETARLVGISESTAARDWRFARAWIGSQLKESAIAPSS